MTCASVCGIHTRRVAGLDTPPSTGARRSRPRAGAPPYLKPVAPEAQLWPILTVGQQIALTGGMSEERFRFVGIPDGLGLYHEGRQLVLLVNHEFRQANGGPAGPLPSAPVRRPGSVAPGVLDSAPGRG